MCSSNMHIATPVCDQWNPQGMHLQYCRATKSAVHRYQFRVQPPHLSLVGVP